MKGLNEKEQLLTLSSRGGCHAHDDGRSYLGTQSSVSQRGEKRKRKGKRNISLALGRAISLPLLRYSQGRQQSK